MDGADPVHCRTQAGVGLDVGEALLFELVGVTFERYGEGVKVDRHDTTHCARCGVAARATRNRTTARATPTAT
jgi:hypothetical protein